MRVLMTGITGIGKTSYAEGVRTRCEQRNQPTAVIHFEDVMAECDVTGTFRTDTMYHHSRPFLEALAAAAVAQVHHRATEAERHGAYHVMLDMHATYCWDHVPFAFTSAARIAEAFQPDLVIALLDNVHDMYRAIEQRTDAASTRFLAEGFPLADLLQWRAQDITMAEQVALAARRHGYARRPPLPGFFLLTVNAGPSLLTQLMCESRFAPVAQPKRVVYASFAISGLKEQATDDDAARKAKEEAREAIGRFRTQLKESFIVLDPYDISEKLLGDAFTKAGEGGMVHIACRDGTMQQHLAPDVAPVVPLIEGQIVDRDERLVRAVESVIIHLPVLPGQDTPAPSEGAAFERIAARLHGRDTVLITRANRERLGPFAQVPTFLCADFDEAIAWFKAHKWIL